MQGFYKQSKPLVGNAQPVEVLAGKTFTNANGNNNTGTMTNRSGSSPRASSTGADGAGNLDFQVPAGYYDGVTSLRSNDPDFVSANVKGGVSIFGLAGKTEVVDTTEASAPATAGNILNGKVGFVNGSKVTGTMTNRSGGDSSAAQNQSFGGYAVLVPPAGYYDGAANSRVVLQDLDFVASNIKAGVDIFGLTGTLVVGKQFATGSALPSSGFLSFTDTAGASSNAYYLEVTGLSFTPSTVIAFVTGGNNSSILANSTMPINNSIKVTVGAAVINWRFTGNVYMNAGGFRLPINATMSQNEMNRMTWFAFE